MVWRLTGFVFYDEGPFRIGARLRALLVRIGLRSVLDCFHCLSVWIALAGTLAVFGATLSSLAVWWGVAGGVSALELAVGGVDARESK
jgi:hypothetical protein